MSSIYVNSWIVHVQIQFTWSILHLLKFGQGLVIFLLRFSWRNMFLILPKSESSHLWVWSVPPTSSACRPAGWRDAPLKSDPPKLWPRPTTKRCRSLLGGTSHWGPGESPYLTVGRWREATTKCMKRGKHRGKKNSFHEIKSTCYNLGSCNYTQWCLL
jgi:hypothetical protein